MKLKELKKISFGKNIAVYRKDIYDTNNDVWSLYMPRLQEVKPIYKDPNTSLIKLKENCFITEDNQIVYFVYNKTDNKVIPNRFITENYKEPEKSKNGLSMLYGLYGLLNFSTNDKTSLLDS